MKELSGQQAGSQVPPQVEEEVTRIGVMVSIGGASKVTNKGDHGVHNAMGLDNNLIGVVVFVDILAIRRGNVKRKGYAITVVTEDTLRECVRN